MNLPGQVKQFLPNLTKVIEHDQAADEPLNFKATLKKSLAASGAAAVFWGLALLDTKPAFLPKIVSLPLGAAAAAATLLSAKLDVRVMRDAFSTVRNAFQPSSPSDGQQPAGVLPKVANGVNLVLSGMMQDRRLARNMLLCSAAEVASDVIDACEMSSRNPLAWAGSVCLSGMLGLKGLDLTLQAYATGLANQGTDRDMPISVRMMKHLGMERSAETILAELDAYPRLKSWLHTTDSGCVAGVCGATGIAARELSAYGMFSDPAALGRGVRDSGILLGGGVASAAASAGILALAYRGGMRRRPQEIARD